MSYEVNVLAEMRKAATEIVWRHDSRPQVARSAVGRWADYVERLEAEKTVARELIKDLYQDLRDELRERMNSPTIGWKMAERVEAYLNPQTGDTL